MVRKQGGGVRGAGQLHNGTLELVTPIALFGVGRVEKNGRIPGMDKL
jgi:hypothetical protein